MNDIRPTPLEESERVMNRRALKKLESNDELISGESHGYRYSVYKFEDTLGENYGLSFYDPSINRNYPVGTLYFDHLDGIRNFLEELVTKVHREVTT